MAEVMTEPEFEEPVDMLLAAEAALREAAMNLSAVGELSDDEREEVRAGARELLDALSELRRKLGLEATA